MKRNDLFKNIQPIAESEVLDDKQMNMLEAGSCSEGCKKSCRPGNQNSCSQKQIIYDNTGIQEMPYDPIKEQRDKGALSF